MSGRQIKTATAADLYSTPGDIDVSGGPLSLVIASDTLIVSNANTGYPLAGTPDSVEYHVYPDEAALVAAVAHGEVDTLLTPNGLTQEQLATMSDNESVSVLASPANGVRYLGFNLAREPMSDQAFRAALALLLDREELAEKIPHTGQVAWSLVPEANGRWFDTELAGENQARYSGTLQERLASALEGLRAVGYTWDKEPALGRSGGVVAGRGLKIDGLAPQPLTILTPGDEYDPARPEYVKEVAETLAMLGFDARPVETDFDSVVDLAFTPGEDGSLHYDMYLLGWTLGSPAMPGYYRPLFSSKGEMNNTGYSSKTFNQALAAYEGAFTTEEAMDALGVMEQTLAMDLPYLLLYTSQLTEVYRSDRVTFDIEQSLGGLQGRLGGIGDVRPKD
jgi:ABC-type transport system substrate-binding protein